MEYRVSILQYEPTLLDVDGNISKLTALMRNLKTDLVVLPELAATGYVFQSPDEVSRVAESIPEGRTFKAMQDLAIIGDVSIVYGFAEKDGDRYFNSAALVNPDGSWHVYRKTHLFFREKLYFQPGDTGFQVYQAKHGITVGLMICYDWQFPEAMRSLALKGAQIICHPSNLVLPWCQQAMITRSLENRVFSVTANRIGTETNGDQSLWFSGQSQIIATKGEIMVRMGETDVGVRTCVIDPTVASDKASTPMNHVFTDRRPELYDL